MEKLPEVFVTRMKDQLGNAADDFFTALTKPSPTSIRLNHHKGKSSFDEIEQVPWCAQGFYLESRPRFHLDPHWHGGAYYVQEASSMILDSVLDHLSLDQTPRVWLDLCAAPGGKTGILAKHLGSSDILIANEVVPQRKSILWENLVKGGYMNTFLTSRQPSAFSNALADIILIDAPCAGEGMMRKEPEAIHQWSPGFVKSCSLLQKQIVSGVIHALKPGGFLIYSTCSYSPDENIYNIADFNFTYSLESIPITFPTPWNIETVHFKDAVGYQMYPHKVKGEGLFIAVLKKNDHAVSEKLKEKKHTNKFIPLPSFLENTIADPSSFLTMKNHEHHLLITRSAEDKAIEVLQEFPEAEIIAQAGQLKGKDFIPSHFVAMAGIQTGQIPRINLDQIKALDYLERSTNSFPLGSEPGWYLASFKDTILGWMKNTSQGWKNHYPMLWRLRSR